MKKFVLLCYKWIKMLCGKDVLHVDQGVGSMFVPGILKGYYNDMTDKVTKNGNIDENGLPFNITASGEKCRLLVAVLQYGLGCYDLYLKTKDREFLQKFNCCVSYIRERQYQDGRFNMYDGLSGIAEERSAMIQGEAASLFVRAYKEANDREYLECARKSIDFMLKSVEEGGTTVYNTDGFYFQELFDKGQDAILNGWIFAAFGLYDFYLVVKEDKYKKILQETFKCIAISLKKYDRGYWSNYNQEGAITSPFYHKLHIAQLEALSQVSKRKEFPYYKERWEKEYNSRLKFLLAFCIKAVQKLRHLNDSEVTVIE